MYHALFSEHGGMMRYTIALALCLFSFEAGAQSANNPKLFKAYEYGAPITDFSRKNGYTDCSAQMGMPSRCLGKTEFLGQNFELALQFQDSKLASVLLYTAFSTEAYTKVMGALFQNFQLCAMQGGKDRLDIVELANNSKDAAALGNKLTTFESVNLSNGRLDYYFLEATQTDLRGKKNLMDLALSLPAHAREADLMVMEDKTGSHLMIKFTLPKLAIQEMEKAMKKGQGEKF